MKKTEIGVIPEDWEVKTIREVTERLIGGGTPSRNIKEYWNGNIPWMTVKDFASFNENCTQEYITNIGLKNSATRIVKANNLIIATRIALGKIVKYKIDVAINQDLKTIELNTNINKDYFAYYYRSIENKIIEKGSGSTVLGLSVDDLYSFQIPLPPLAEQEAIASALSDADSWIESLEQLIAKKRLIKQGAMQTLLTPQEDWEVKKLGEVAEIIMGQSPLSENYNQNGVGLPLVQGNADIDNRKTIIRNYTSQITKRGKIGDIVMSVRAPVGEIAKATFECCLGRGVCAIRAKNDYLYHYLIFSENNWGQFSTGSTFDSVNSNQVNDFSIALPKSLSEQDRIATILSDMDAELEALETQLAKARQIKQGMMQELLTGRTRLV